VGAAAPARKQTYRAVMVDTFDPEEFNPDRAGGTNSQLLAQ